MISKSKWIFAVSRFAGCTLLFLPAFGQKTTQVLVVNGTGSPVPTAPQGTTNVAGTVNVGNTPNVTVANTPSVNIANSPSVSISGTPTVVLSPGGSTGVTNSLDGQNNPTPLAVLEAIQIWEDSCGISIPPSTNGGTCNFQQIPSGKRLVVEEFDAKGILDPGLKPVELDLIVSGLASHYFPATFMGTQSGGDDFFATHQTTRLYAPANIQPTCTVTLSANVVSGGGYYCRLSGFLVDVQ